MEGRGGEDGNRRGRCRRGECLRRRLADHPRDVVEEGDATTRFRTMYLGGAGVVAALHRLAQRGFVELQRDYVPGDLGTALYLADCIDGEGEPLLP